MTLALIALLIASTGGVAALAARGRIHPFVSLLVAAIACGLAAELSLPYTLRSMEDGFSSTIGSLGPVFIAAAVAGIALHQSQFSQWLSAVRVKGKGPLTWMTGCGLIGGLGAVGEVALILLMPLADALARRLSRPAGDTALPLALAITATNTLLVPAPGPVAAAAILSADLWQTALWGAMVALAAAAAGWVFSLFAGGWLSRPAKQAIAVPAPPQKAGAASLLAALAGLLPIVLPLLLLTVSSVGHMPSEPLGGGWTREILLTLGQPLILLLTALAAAALAAGWPRPRTALLSEDRIGQALTQAAGTALLIGVAGAFSRVLQNAGLDSMLGDDLAGVRLGILLPFAIAAAMKLAQGSSMLAIITTAGLMHPSLTSLGLDDESGRALSAVAVGAGSMVASHVNDTLFWTFTRLCKLTPAQGLRLLTLGTLVQGTAAATALLAISAVVR